MFLMSTALYTLYLSVYYACFIEETLSLAAAIKAGAEKVAGISRERYLLRLKWLKEATRFSVVFSHDERKKPAYVRISNLLESLRLDDADGRIRPQPFCVVLCGAPGCGKTGMAMRLASEFMKSRYGKFNSRDIVTLNETDEFQSEYRTNHKVVIFDDIGAETAAFAVNPWRKVIDFVNNIRKTSINPNLELKGNVYIEPDLVILTTNMDRRLGVHTYLNCPEAIYRRISAFLYLEPFGKVVEFPRSDPSYTVIEDRSAFTRGTEFRLFNNSDSLRGRAPLRPIEELIPDLIERFKVHFEEQTQYVDAINSYMDPPEECVSAWEAFLRDQIYPRWPRKVPLPTHVERQLPWYHRLTRRFCIEDDKVAMCQMDLEPKTPFKTKEVLPRIEKDEESLTSSDSQASYVNALSDFQDGLRWPYLQEHFNLKHFQYFQDRISDESSYWLFPFGFVEAHFTGHSMLVYPADSRLFTASLFEHPRPCFGPYIRGKVLRAYAQSLAKDATVASINTEQKRSAERVQVNQSKKPISLALSHKYPGMDIKASALTGKKYNKILKNCQRKIPEMHGRGCLRYHPSSLLTYQFIRRAWHYGYQRPVIEYEFSGLTPDAFILVGETPVIIESKCTMSPCETIMRYLRYYDRETAIGVGINYQGYWIYTLGEVPHQDFVHVAQICSAVFRFFEKYGIHFGLGVPFKKYKDHCTLFDPPSKIYSKNS
jgi:DNA replication protein DnaC